MKTTIINFSTRDNGNCFHIADVCQDKLTAAEVQRFDFGSISLYQCGKCDYECLGTAGSCIYDNEDDCNAIYEAVADAGQSVFIIPNYCGYPNSNYFMFCERACGYYRLAKENRGRYLSAKKKFIVVTNSNLDNFRETLKLQNADGAADILFLESRLFKKNPANGDLMEDAAAKELVENFILA